jgi:hypothetical protein
MCSTATIKRVICYYFALAVVFQVINAIRPAMTLKTYRRRFACWNARYNCLHFHNVWLDDIDRIAQPDVIEAKPATYGADGQRILVAVAAYDLDSRGKFVQKLLVNFAEMCDAGYNMHVIVYTVTLQRDALTRTIPPCRRTGKRKTQPHFRFALTLKAFSLWCLMRNKQRRGSKRARIRTAEERWHL